jgi:transcriptional regulator NrdR family protein
MLGMRCPICHFASRVLDSRPTDGDGAVKRRRRCGRCGERFTTWERVDLETTELERAVVAFVRELDPTAKGATA